MKVYGWTGWRRACKAAANGSRQTREICAAASKAEVRRICHSRCPANSEIEETGNKRELQIALANPNVVYWKPLDDHPGNYSRCRD